jgi:protein phosphatase
MQWPSLSSLGCLPLHNLQGKERRSSGDATSAAARVASRVLDEARSLRTKDNTSVIFVDFDVLRRDPCISPVD